MPPARKFDEKLEQHIQELLNDEQYADHPLREALSDLWDAMFWQIARLEKVTDISDRYQRAARERVNMLSRRYDRQINLLERVLRISDRYQSMLKDLNEALREASTHDLLTGIANRRLMIDYCRQADDLYAEAGTCYSLVVIDADHFKNINDTYGHDFGDQMLIELASVLRRSLRGSDACSRWGGEEFLGLLNGAGIIEAEPIVGRLLETLQGTTLKHEDKDVTITVSMGLAEHEEGETYADHLPSC